MRPGTFIMDGVNSETINTFIQDRPLIDAPQRKVEWKSGYGVDGDIPFDENAYDDTELDLVLVTNGMDLVTDRQEVLELLDTKGVYGEFIPYFDPDKIYRVMLRDKVQFENKYYYGNAQASSVKFKVKPYKYLIDSPSKTVTVKNTTIFNPTRYTSQPILRIEGSGNVKVLINGVAEFNMVNIPSKIVIDSERYSAYTEGATGPLESMNDRVTSLEYPLLLPGLNSISVTGSVSSIEIEPRWRSLV